VNQEKITEERAREDNDGERQRLQAKLESTEASVNDWSTKLLDAQEKVDQIKAEVKKVGAEDQAARKQRDDQRRVLGEVRQRLNTLEQSKTSSLSVYHPAMPAVAAEINRQIAQFHEPPVGPLGASVKLKKEEWAGVCENIFGRNLNAFLVANFDDARTLRRLLEKRDAYASPKLASNVSADIPVIISNPDPFDYRSGEPDPKYDTVLRILDVLRIYYFC